MNNDKNKKRDLGNPFDNLREQFGLDKMNDKENTPPQYFDTLPPKYILSKDTRNLVENVPSDNFVLDLTRRIPTHTEKGEFKIDKLFTVQDKDYKGRSITKVDRPTRKIGTENIDYTALCNRTWQLAKGLCEDEPKKFDAEFKERMVMGLGTESVHETSMTLHHVFGIPYIPSSALKGVVRSWIIQNEFDNKEELAIRNEWFIDIFGCSDQIVINGKPMKSLYDGELGKARQGNVMFFDAFPTAAPTIELDIMNPHYPEYYSKGKPPTDTQKLIPIPFITVAQTSFKIVFGFKKATKEQSQTSEALLLIVEKYMKDALSNHGIGAKTAVGYGYMKS